MKSRKVLSDLENPFSNEAMVWYELDRPPINGELNTHFFVTDGSGSLFLKRVPKENLSLWKQIATEYTETMFLSLGGTFRQRSLAEQVSFSSRASELGLRVLPPAALVDGAAYYPYLEGALPIKEYFASSEANVPHVVTQLFNDLRKAHSLEIVYGDRWLPNILVTDTQELVHIDFDIKISGRWAKEFEVAQVIYYTVLAGKESVFPHIIEHIKPDPWFDPLIVTTFLDASLHFFKNTEYGNIDNLISRIVLDSGWKSDE